jgi:plastocyanin
MRSVWIRKVSLSAALALAACSGSGGGATPDGAMSPSDAAGAVFRSIGPCMAASDYVFSNHVQTVDTPAPAYSPKCIKVPRNTTVTLEASATHPITGTQLPGTDPGSAIPVILGGTVNPVIATFTESGFFSFECVEHTQLGMKGVVWVTPE